VKWLEADLAKNTKKCVLAYWHHPRFNSGKHGPFNSATPFWKLFIKHGVVQLTVGTGGVGFSEFVSPHPASAARQNDTYGVVKLRLGATGWNSEFLGVPGLAFTDTASGECR